MKEINWKSVAQEYELTPDELQEQICIAGCIMGDMTLDKSGETADAMRFTCDMPTYKLELTVKRIDL